MKCGKKDGSCGRCSTSWRPRATLPTGLRARHRPLRPRSTVTAPRTNITVGKRLPWRAGAGRLGSRASPRKCSTWTGLTACWTASSARFLPGSRYTRTTPRPCYPYPRYPWSIIWCSYRTSWRLSIRESRCHGVRMTCVCDNMSIVRYYYVFTLRGYRGEDQRRRGTNARCRVMSHAKAY